MPAIVHHREALRLAGLMLARLEQAGITTSPAAAALATDDRDRVLGVAAWSAVEDAAWDMALSVLTRSRPGTTGGIGAGPNPSRVTTRNPSTAAVAETVYVTTVAHRHGTSAYVNRTKAGALQTLYGTC